MHVHVDKVVNNNAPGRLPATGRELAMKPTKGRIVFYTHDDSDPVTQQHYQSPAIVQAVNADTTLKPLGCSARRASEKEDNVPARLSTVASTGTWMWPPRES